MESRHRNYDKARELFHNGLLADPTSGHIWSDWARLEDRQNNVEKARELFQLATEANPGDHITWARWALFEKWQSNFRKARELFSHSTQLNPKDVLTWLNWARLEQEQQNIDKARELFDRGSQVDPTNAEIWQAWSQFELGFDVPWSLAISDHALQYIHTSRERASLLVNHGRALARLQCYPRAEEDFQDALSLDESNYHAHFFYANNVLIRQGRHREACWHLNKALALQPQSPRDRQNIERALQRLSCPA